MILDEPDGATPLDPGELEGLLHPHVTTRGELDELEQANITEGLLWLGRRKSHEVLTDTYLRTLHKRLFGQVWAWVGTYRISEKNIGVAPHQIVMQLSQLLGNAHFWAEQSVYPALESAARFHHRLVQIHVFPNGNGRHGRIATDEYLRVHFGHAPVRWASGTDLFADSKRRTEYIKALRLADDGNFEALIDFVTP